MEAIHQALVSVWRMRALKRLDEFTRAKLQKSSMRFSAKSGNANSPRHWAQKP
jgi:hypothetical protein